MRPTENALAGELLTYLASLTTRIDRTVFADLIALGTKHRRGGVFQEKAVDVMLAVDLATMATADDYDAAYILSADGDFTPAARFARNLGKKVYAVSANRGAQLASAVNSFIRIDKPWLADCYS